MPGRAEPAPDRRPADRARDAVVRGVHRLGWRVAGRVPERVVRVVVAGLSRVVSRSHGPHLQNLRTNLAAVTGQPPSDALVRAAVASYLRNFWEVLALPRWTADELLGRVRTEDEHWLREAFADGGAVVALPHSGNWDRAGA